MKIPTYKSVSEKVIVYPPKKLLNCLEKFIADFSPWDGDKNRVRKFMRDLQKVVDFVERKTNDYRDYHGRDDWDK